MKFKSKREKKKSVGRLHLRQRFASVPKLKTNILLVLETASYFMVNYRVLNAVRFSTLFFLLLVLVVNAFGQSKCVSDDEVKKIVDGINSQKNATFNKNLQQQLLQIKQDTGRIYAGMPRFSNDSEQQFEARLNQQREKNAASFCQILRQYGWASKAAVGADASDIASAIFLDSLALDAQKQLIPVIEAAFKADEISKSNYAKMVDQLRVRSGQKQIFGTVIGVAKDLLLLYPIQNEAAVDNLRRQYELPPLAEQIRRFEQQYQAVVIKSPSSLPISIRAQQQEVKPRLTITDDEKDEVIKVETNLVSLNATVMPEKPGMVVPPLNKEDFSIFENGREQSVEFFAATQVPFDITLLIDVSGSTANKIKLIRKTTRSFIKAARPSDRISIVVFDQEVTVISPLTENRESLLASVDKIKSGGGSKVWDALAVTLDKSAAMQNTNPQNREQQRRSGIVFMTDGADNSFVNDVDASSITFADLLEKVRRSSTLIVPIHLDTRQDYGLSEKLYYGTRRALNLLADESGGLFYEARKYEDLENVYGEVINDLSRVYSLGYSPSTDSKSVWRSVKLSVKNHPNLTVRARNGYYAH